MPRLALVLAVFPILAFRLSATPCVAGGTLASYEALGGTGCTIGTETVEDFIFSVVSVSGTATALTDSEITVTPTFGIGFDGVQFASTGFLVSGAGSVNYLIGYFWDSIAIRGMGDVLDPGPVSILTDGCVGAAFSGSSCSGTVVSVAVGTGDPTDFVSFSPNTDLGIRNDISITSLASQTASFNSIENDVYFVPEPSSFLLAGLGLTILAAGIRRRSGFRLPAGPRFTATND